MAKKVQLSKKINGVVHQIYPKTVYDVVVDKNGKTLQQDIEAINSDLERIEDSIPTKLSDLQGGAEIVTESEINAKLDNYYTKDAIDSKLENIGSGTVDLKNYYTKDEVYNKSQVDDLLDDVQIQDLSEYAKKSDLFSKDYNDLDNRPTIISKEEVIELIDQAQFPEGGDIELQNYYTKGEVDGYLASINKNVASKQDTLVSGVNIKKINGKSILGSGNIDISGGGSSIEIITSNDTTTSPSDEKVYSALKVDNEFTRNNEKETIQKQWQFQDKTIFNGNVEFNKAIQKPAIFEEHIQSPDYTGNVLGSGWYLGFDNGTNSHLEVDTLKVRKKAIFDTLEIKHVAHVGGEIMLTPAGAKISKVEAYNGDEGYKCFFKASGEDEDGNQLNYQNEFAKNDLVMCKTFNLKDGQQRYYWRKCIGVNYTPDENGYFWIILSKDDEDKLGTMESDSPISGDVIVTVGNSEDVNRQNAIVISAYSSDAPSICLYKGIGTPDPDPKKNGNIYSLRDDIMPVRISPKGNKFTGDFFIENKDYVAGSLVQVLESLISFSVTGLSYNELLGVDAVDRQVESGSNYVLYSLKEDVVKTWQQGDNVAIKLRFNEEALQNKTNITISLQGELQGRFDSDEQTIEAKDLENPSIKLFQRNGIGFTSGNLHIKITGSENCLPYSIEARAGFNTELRRTGIDIENGTITLQSDATYIKTSDNDDPKTIAEFTEDKIALSTYEEIYKEVQGQNAVTGKQSFTDKTVYSLDPNVVNKWEKDDIIAITFERPLKETIKIWSEDGLAEVLNEVTIESGKTCASFTCLKSPSDTNSESYSLKVTPAINYDMEVRCSLKADLRRTGIDIEKGTITLNADTTIIKDGDGELPLAEFTEDKISFGLTEVNERLDVLDQTLINIENGKITLDADETTIKDTDLTLAQFTKDQASISVYETIYNRVDGANAVKGTGTSGSNYQIFSLNKDIINLWKIGDVIEFTLSLTEPLNANQTITVVGINGLQNAIDSKTIPNTLFVNNIAQWTTKLNMSISDIGSLQNPAIRVALSNNSRINCTLTAKCSLKQDLKRTGIDIESGLITLDADKTVIKDGNDSFDIASFTKNQITLQTESEGNAASDTNSYGKASELISGSGVVYYRDYDLKKDIVSKWKKGEIITMSFVIQRLSAGKPTITVTGIGNLEGILSTTEISHTLGTRVIQCSVLCLEDAAHLATSDDLKLRISAGFNNEQGNLEIYSKLYGEIKKAGIDLNDGTITLNADTTKIKSGEKDIALFTVNSKGVAVLNTEFIDADRIETNKLETEGTIKNSGQKVNYLTVSDDNLTVYNDQAVPKVKIHSGTLNSSGGTETIDYKTGLTVFPDEREFDLVIAENIQAKRSNNYITFDNVKIDLNWTTQGLSDYKSILTYDVVLRDSDSNETSLLRNQTIEPSKTQVTKTITLPSKTLSTNKKYSLIIKFMKQPDGHSISVSPRSGKATINYPQNLSEIASDGYNFQFGDGKYQTARDDGFEIVYGSYGFKVSADGIHVKKPGNNDWVSLFGGIV